MAGAFTAVDLSKIAAPDVVEQIDFETILAEMITDLQARDAEFSALVESDPAYKILEVCAYRETLIRQRANEAARAVMLAYATKADLDNLAANYNVERLLIDAGDPDAVPPIDPTYETDEDFRRRIQLSFEGFSTAGPEGAYIFHALGADPQVLDASVDSPAPGEVLVTVLSRDGDGTPSVDLVDAVRETLRSEDVRPLTDQVTVQGAIVNTYSIEAELTLYPGPDSEVVRQAAEDAVTAYAEENHRLGRDVTLSGLLSALHQPGVQNAVLVSPTSGALPIVNGVGDSSYASSISVIVVGRDE